MSKLKEMEDKVFEDLTKRIVEAIGNVDPTQRGKKTVAGKTYFYSIDGKTCHLKRNKKSITIVCHGGANVIVKPFTDVGDIERMIYRKIVYQF